MSEATRDADVRIKLVKDEFKQVCSQTFGCLVMNLKFSYFLLLYDSRVCLSILFSQSTFSSMTEVVIAEDDYVGSMESNEEDGVKLWKFCNSITLPRSEVVFFTQATQHIHSSIFILIASLLKLTLDRLPCEEMSV